MRLSELRGKTVRSLDGKALGRVHEVHCDKRKVVALMCGPGSLIERWTARKKGRRVPWEQVKRIEPKAVIIADGESSASRTRQGTRRPSGRQSKR